MYTFKFKTILLTLLSISLHSNLSIANEAVISPDKFQSQKNYFELIGQNFMARKDNLYIINQFGVNNSLVTHHAFLKDPDTPSCVKHDCQRKEITKNQNFKIESIVAPKVREGRGFGDNVCDKNVIFCYYKLVFDDKDIAYIRVADFLDAQNPTRAYVLDAQPWKLQIIPLKPNASWKKQKRLYDNHFKKSGVSLGFTKEDVLKSHWGKPQFKTKSASINMDIEIWSYNGGQLSIVDGYVTDITTTN